ncbi:hypothetical protein MBRA_35120 [Mycobacterium branderi]|uniref:Secreted protein n=1 Tax=Mycobacterium branderi TaxID=43348 RepID=A0ABM7KQF1_9MYCO|nr:hypothetical protein MBRA_35120 [Mycobacterium branderi]
MKRLVSTAMRAAVFAIPVAVMISGAPLASAVTDVEDNCRNTGGDYTSQEVQPHWGAAPVLIETCCTAGQCVTYRDGVKGPTYGGG